MRFSTYQGYQVVEWSLEDGTGIRDLLNRYPELVLGHYLVNTSFDSGALTLSDDELGRGWSMSGGLAHSPAIQSVDEVPIDQFDEWLVFESPGRVESFETMVNYLTFSPIAFEWQEKFDHYWAQLAALRPLHVIGQNGRTYLISRDQALVEKINRSGQGPDWR